MNLFTTNQFKRAVKKLKREHNTRALDDLWKAVQKIYNQEVGSSMDNHRLAGKNTNNLNDLHLAGGDLILLWRYDSDTDSLVVSAKIKDVVNHDALSRKETFAEPQWRETTIDELDKQINGSTYLDDSLTVDAIEDWFYNYYNKVIASILPIDDIHVDNIIDKFSEVQIEATGVQYDSTCSDYRYRTAVQSLTKRCEQDNVECNLEKCDLSQVTSSLYYEYEDDEFGIRLTLIVPIDIEY